MFLNVSEPSNSAFPKNKGEEKLREQTDIAVKV
jgi:hypothetical protein